MATPLNSYSPITFRLDDPENVTVITVPDARPLGACAEKTLVLVVCPDTPGSVRSTFQVRPPPLTLDTGNAPPRRWLANPTMKSPAATAAVVVIAIVVLLVVADASVASF